MVNIRDRNIQDFDFVMKFPTSGVHSLKPGSILMWRETPYCGYQGIIDKHLQLNSLQPREEMRHLRWITEKLLP